MNKVDEQTIKDFMELKCTYKESKIGKSLKGYDQNSGENVLEDKVYYSINELDVYVNAVEAYINHSIPWLDNEEFTKWLMVARGVLIKNIQFEGLDEAHNTILFNLFMKLHNLFTYLDEHIGCKRENVENQCLEIVKYIKGIK